MTAPTGGTVPPTRRGRRAARQILRDAADYRALRATAYGMTPVVVLTLIDFVQKFDDAIFALLLPEIRADLEVSLSAVTAIASIVGVAIIGLQPVIGYVADRRRRGLMVGISSVVSGLFSLLTGRASGVGQLAAIRAADEAGESAGNIPTASLLADYYPPETRGRAYALRQVALDGAKLLAPITVGAIAVSGGWRAPFLVTGPALVVVGILAVRTLQEPVRGYWERRAQGASEDVAVQPEPPMSFGEAVRTISGTRTLRRLLIALALIQIGSAWFSVLFNFYLSEEFGYDALQRGALAIPGGVAGIVGAFLGGGLADVLVRRRPGRVLSLIGMISLAGAFAQLLVVAVPDLAVLVAVLVVFGLVSGIVFPASASVISLVIPPRLRGQGLGVMALVGLPAVALQFVAGQLGDAYGLRGGLFACVPILAVGALVYASAGGFFESDMRSALAAAMAGEEHRRAKEAGELKLLVCRDVDVAYGSVQVLFGVDLDVHEGEILALLGTNGAGKSTLLRAVSGTQPASSGAVVFDGRDITRVPPHEITRLGIAHMPGGRGVFPGLTVRENLELALWIVPAEERATRLDEALAGFPALDRLLDRRAGLLSGGEQQMVALAQAFLARPRLLLIDELSLGLAPAAVQQLLELIRAIHARGTTIVLVEQSVNLALTVADRAVFMEKGEVRFEGPTAHLLERPDIMRAVYVKGSAGLTSGPRRSAAASSPTAGRPILEVSGLAKRYGGVTAVDSVDVTLREGEALGFIGPNGAGKTTLFELISGHQPADSGRVVLDGVDVSRHGPDARARAGLVRRFQDARLFPSLTVHETIRLALERHLEVRSMFLTALGAPAVRRVEARASERADRLVEMLELAAVRDKLVSELSTGQRRIVDLACVLAAEPKVLLLDEPSSGIAQAEAEQLGPLLRRVRHETGCSLLIIEHDMQLIAAVSDELVAMVQGRVVARGPADDVLSDPVVVEAYLGTSDDVLHRQGALS